MLGIVYHAGYLTDDIDKSIAYYKAMFGGKLVKQLTAADGVKIAYVQVGDSEVELIQPADKSKLNGRTGLVIDHIGYFVPDIDKAIAELKARGIGFATAEPVVSALGYRMIYIDAASTMGASIHLTESKPE